MAARLRDDGAWVLGPQLGVTDDTACRDSVQRTRVGLDVLVNNAVMLLGPVVDADTEDWRRMMTTNVLGLMYMTHAAVPGMAEQGSGEMVNISRAWPVARPVPGLGFTTPASGRSTLSASRCAKRSPPVGCGCPWSS